MDQSNSKWTRWIAIALCALALNAAKRADESGPAGQVVTAAAAADQPASPPVIDNRGRC
jgi:hypothetical protein